MLADTSSELVSFAKKLNVPVSYISFRGCYNESLDVWKSKRKKALKLGAISVTRQEVGTLIERKKIAYRDAVRFDTQQFS